MTYFVITFTTKEGNKNIKSIGASDKESAKEKLRNMFSDIQSIDSVEEE